VDGTDGNLLRFQIRVLGPVQIETDSAAAADAPRTVASAAKIVELAPKPRLLVALLATRSGHWITSDTLIGELWPGQSIPSAHKTLQGNILRLRRLLDPEVLLSKRGSYCLRHDAPVDANEFRTRAEFIDGIVHRNELDRILREVTQAESLWRGEPFENVEDTPMLVQARHQLTGIRHRLRELRIDSMIQRGQARSVVNELESCVNDDAYREDYWALLIRSLYLSGRPSDALSAFGRARRILANDLGLEPGSTLKALEAAVLRSDDSVIRSGQISGGSSQSSFSIGAAEPTSSNVSGIAIPLDDPFVGRTAEMATARNAVKASRNGRRKTLLIQGDAGIGKTRLLAEIVREAEAFGAIAIFGRNDSLIRRSYGVIIELLDQLDVMLASSEHGGESPVDPEITRPLERLRKLRLLGSADQIFDAPSSNPALDRQVMAEVVNQQLTAAARRLGTLIIVIEDIQWADSGTLDVIRELTTSSLPAPIFIGLTYRNETRRPDIARVLHEVDRSGSAVRMHLIELPDEELRELMFQVGGRRGEVTDHDLKSMLARTDGNTLLLRELTVSRHQRHTDLHATDVPESVADLVDSYLAECSAHSALVAEVGSLCGRSFSPELASSVAAKLNGEPNLFDTAVKSAVELEQSELVVATSPGVVMFRHDLFRDSVVARLEPGELRKAHAAFLAELEDQSSDDLDALILHSVGAEQASTAADRLTERARRSLAGGLVDEAIRDCTEAIRWHESDPTTSSLRHRLNVSLLLSDAYALTANRGLAKTFLEEILLRCVDLPDDDQALIRATTHRRLASVHMNDRNTGKAIDELAAAAKLVGRAQPTKPEMVSEWIEVWLDAVTLDYFTGGTVPWTFGALGRLEPVVAQQGTLRQATQLRSRTSMKQLRDSRFSPSPGVLELNHEFRESALRLGDLGLIAEATFAIGFAHFARLEGREAHPYFYEATELHRRAGDHFWESISRVYAAAALRLTGDVEATAASCIAALHFGADNLLPSYVALFQSCLAWVELQKAPKGNGFPPTAQPHLDVMFQSMRDATVIGFYPYVGFMVWPAISIAVSSGQHNDVARYAAMLLDPPAQKLPDHVESFVTTLTKDPSNARAVDAALLWARSVHFL
jgi:DNA-binding SARP family transcriptional activator